MSAAAPNEKFRLVCVRCGAEHATDCFRSLCDHCGGLLDVEYDLARVLLADSPDPLVRFFDLLPVRGAAGWPPLEMRPTPCAHAARLGARLGLPHLYLKDESRLPTGTTKDRMAVVALAYVRERGARAFCTSSTGNSSTSFARALAHFPGCRMFLFTAEAFLRRVQHADHERVAHFVLRDATFVDAFACSMAFAARHGIVAERGFFNPGRREGLKLAFLEAAEQVPRAIDWYVQAVSSAMGVYGTYKGARELLALGRIPHLPRLLCVQQQTCAPMVRAYEDGSESIRPEHVVPRPTGIAEAILRGDPSRAYPYVRQFVVESGGTFVAVGEHEIREARRMLEEEEGLTPCFNAAAAFAGLVALVRRGTFPLQDTVLVNLTGSDRPADVAPPRVCWLRATSDGWAPEQPTDAAALSLWHNPRRWLD